MTIIEPCSLIPYRDGRFTLSAQLVALMGDGRKVTVPKGFVTDFASSNLGRWDFLSRSASRSYASIVHDWLYFTGMVNRVQADRYFVEGLKDEGCGWYDRMKAAAGLRMFGWIVWQRYRRHERP